MCYVHHESMTGAHKDQFLASDSLELEQLEWLWANMCMLGIKFRFSAGSPGVLNLWVIFPESSCNVLTSSDHQGLFPGMRFSDVNLRNDCSEFHLKVLEAPCCRVYLNRNSKEFLWYSDDLTVNQNWAGDTTQMLKAFVR